MGSPDNQTSTLSSAGDMTDFDKTASDLMLQVNLDDDVKLATQASPVIWAPLWGLSLSLDGNRDYTHIFRLPNMGGWIRRWVYSRGAETELVPENALESATAESTSIFRALPNFGQAMPVVSTHWFLCPVQSCNGFTVGLAYLDVAMDRTDSMAVSPVDCGRFAMDETTGEVFITSWRGDGVMIVAWTQSISSCERVRELFLFEASNIDGMPPDRVILRNSFYERRNCRICGVVVGSKLSPPCRAPASRLRRQSRKMRPSSDSLPPLQNMYRRFRGNFFGTCVKTRYNYTSNGTTMSTQAVPIYLDIRHGIASISRRLKLNLRQTALSFGIDPRVSARMLAVKPYRRITAYGVDLENCGDLSGNASSECSMRASPSRSERNSAPDDAKRRRNADGVDDRESTIHMRKLRNRASAARTNALRKRRIEEHSAELEDLKSNVVPALKLKEQQLKFENKRLKEMVAASKAISDDRIMTPGIIGEIPLNGSFEFTDDLFF